MKIYKEQNDERWHIVFSSNSTPPTFLFTLSHSDQTGSFKHFVSLLSAGATKNQGRGKSKKKRKEKKIIRQGKNISSRNKLISLIFFSFPSLSMVIFCVTVIKY